jgi:hypothetical protein
MQQLGAMVPMFRPVPTAGSEVANGRPDLGVAAPAAAVIGEARGVA